MNDSAFQRARVCAAGVTRVTRAAPDRPLDWVGPCRWHGWHSRGLTLWNGAVHVALWLSLSSACGAAGLSCLSRKADIIWFCVLQNVKVLVTFFPSKCISLKRDIKGETEVTTQSFNIGIRNSRPALSLCLFSLHVCKSVLMEVSPDFTYTSSALASLIMHLCVSVAVLHHKQFSYNEIFWFFFPLLLHSVFIAVLQSHQQNDNLQLTV